MDFDFHVVGSGIVESVDAELAFILRCDERCGQDEPVELAAAIVVLRYGFGEVLYPKEWIAVGVDGTAADVVKHGASCRR